MSKVKRGRETPGERQKANSKEALEDCDQNELGQQVQRGPGEEANLKHGKFVEPSVEEIMKRKQGKVGQRRTKRGAKERAFRMVKILGQGAFANVFLVETKETG